MKSSVIQKRKWNKIFTITTEGPCNLDCLGCGTPRLYKPRPIKKIMQDIKKGSDAGYKVIEIIGGEPTVHKDFIQLVKYARSLFNEICLTTNGITLADINFTKQILSLIDFINISLYGHNKDLHQAWTGREGSFKKTVKGIKNCLNLKQDKLLITHLIWKKNFPFIKSIILFDIELGIKDVDLLNIQPIGKAKKIYKDLAVPLNNLNNFDLEIIDLLDNFKSVEIEDYPPCIFSKNLWEKTMQNVHIVDIAGQIFIDKDNKINCYDLFMVHNLSEGIDSTLKTEKHIRQIGEKYRNYRRYLRPCKNCRFINRCNGIFNEYIKINGEKNTENELININKNKDNIKYRFNEM